MYPGPGRPYIQVVNKQICSKMRPFGFIGKRPIFSSKADMWGWVINCVRKAEETFTVQQNIRNGQIEIELMKQQSTYALK